MVYRGCVYGPCWCGAEHRRGTPLPVGVLLADTRGQSRAGAADDDVARLRGVVMNVRTILAQSSHRHFRGMTADCPRCLSLEIDRVLSETRPRVGDGPCLDEYDPDGHGTVQCEAPIGHEGAHRCNVGGWGWSWPVTT